MSGCRASVGVIGTDLMWHYICRALRVLSMFVFELDPKIQNQGAIPRNCSGDYTLNPET